MNLPLWFEWRRQAAIQWYRDARGIKTYGAVSLPGRRQAAIKGCGTKEIRCVVCDHLYDSRSVTFQIVMEHMVQKHPTQAVLTYIL